MAKVLVTGANGHLGANTVRALLAAGHEVRALVREGADGRGLAGLEIERVTGDVRDRPAVERAAEGCDYAINHAAVYATRSETAAEIIEPAVAAIENVLRAAGKAGVKRVVHTSSTAAIGPPARRDRPATETQWYEAARMPYYRAKLLSERRAHELAAKLLVPMVVLNPCAMLGPYDYRRTPSTRVVAGFLNGTTPAPNGGIGVVDVRDAAAAHVAALERGEAGERYIVAGENMTFRQIAGVLRDLTGIRALYAPMPRALIPVAVPLMGTLDKLRGRVPTLTRDEAHEVVGVYLFVDASKARAALGFAPRPIRECLADAIRWSLHADFLSDKTVGRLAGRFAPEPGWI